MVCLHKNMKKKVVSLEAGNSRRMASISIIVFIKILLWVVWAKVFLLLLLSRVQSFWRIDSSVPETLEKLEASMLESKLVRETLCLLLCFGRSILKVWKIKSLISSLALFRKSSKLVVLLFLVTLLPKVGFLTSGWKTWGRGGGAKKKDGKRTRRNGDWNHRGSITNTGQIRVMVWGVGTCWRRASYIREWRLFFSM